jgi:hypothetical protein
VAAVARRKERLAQLVGEIDKASGTALPIEANITDRSRPTAAVHEAVERALKEGLFSPSSTYDLCGQQIVLIDAALDHELEY